MIGYICGIKRFAVHDGEGLRTTVFLKGCPLKCVWCHNPEGISFSCQVGFYAQKCLQCGTCANICPQKAISIVGSTPTIDHTLCNGCFTCTDACPSGALEGFGIAWELEDLAQKLVQDKCFFDSSHGGVTISGGECLAQPDFTIALAKRLQELGVRVNIDTCGFTAWSVLEQVAPYTDTFLYDVKAIDPAVHKRCTGQDNTRILENLRRLCEAGHRVEIRYPYVPGYNDTQCHAIGAFLAPLPGITKVKVLGYHTLADGKYEALGMENTLPPTAATAAQVEAAAEILRSFGLVAINGMKED